MGAGVENEGSVPLISRLGALRGAAEELPGVGCCTLAVASCLRISLILAGGGRASLSIAGADASKGRREYPAAAVDDDAGNDDADVEADAAVELEGFLATRGFPPPFVSGAPPCFRPLPSMCLEATAEFLIAIIGAILGASDPPLEGQ